MDEVEAAKEEEIVRFVVEGAVELEEEDDEAVEVEFEFDPPWLLLPFTPKRSRDDFELEDCCCCC